MVYKRSFSIFNSDAKRDFASLLLNGLTTLSITFCNTGRTLFQLKRLLVLTWLIALLDTF